jgi:hypothetical protein
LMTRKKSGRFLSAYCLIKALSLKMLKVVKGH